MCYNYIAPREYTHAATKNKTNTLPTMRIEPLVSMPDLRIDGDSCCALVRGEFPSLCGGWTVGLVGAGARVCLRLHIRRVADQFRISMRLPGTVLAVQLYNQTAGECIERRSCVSACECPHTTRGFSHLTRYICNNIMCMVCARGNSVYITSVRIARERVDGDDEESPSHRHRPPHETRARGFNNLQTRSIAAAAAGRRQHTLSCPRQKCSKKLWRLWLYVDPLWRRWRRRRR